MTREEREKIKREAEEQVNVCTPYHPSSFVQGYIVAAVTWQTKYEKENAELKAEIENDRDLPAVAYMQGAENQKKKDEKQLTKAKELLTKWVELFKPKGGNIPPTPIQVDTEQFLKEEEE